MRHSLGGRQPGGTQLMIDIDTPLGLERPRLLERGAQAREQQVRLETVGPVFQSREVDHMVLDLAGIARRRPARQRDDSGDGLARDQLSHHLAPDHAGRPDHDRGLSHTPLPPTMALSPISLCTHFSSQDSTSSNSRMPATPCQKLAGSRIASEGVSALPGSCCGRRSA